MWALRTRNEPALSKRPSARLYSPPSTRSTSTSLMPAAPRRPRNVSSGAAIAEVVTLAARTKYGVSNALAPSRHARAAPQRSERGGDRGGRHLGRQDEVRSVECFFFQRHGAHGDLHSFPSRRAPD